MNDRDLRPTWQAAPPNLHEFWEVCGWEDRPDYVVLTQEQMDALRSILHPDNVRYIGKGLYEISTRMRVEVWE